MCHRVEADLAIMTAEFGVCAEFLHPTVPFAARIFYTRTVSGGSGFLCGGFAAPLDSVLRSCFVVCACGVCLFSFAEPVFCWCWCGTTLFRVGRARILHAHYEVHALCTVLSQEGTAAIWCLVLVWGNRTAANTKLLSVFTPASCVRVRGVCPWRCMGCGCVRRVAFPTLQRHLCSGTS